ncbi:tetratricopeptide repeat protein [Aestuariivirga sp.]|jgi:Tfp pilus assembly protein PilF|uniref:SPOR domain-containing protein n=1 Tax=Aestuariivirga sp. TaxID=2650926 RepID=UPI00378442FD
MSIRTPFLVTACSVFLAASVAVSGTHAASTEGDLVTAAYEALQSGNVEIAIADYTRAIDSRSLSPDTLANALLNRGLAYQRMNEHEFAIDDYTAALRIDAMSGSVRALALYNRGLSYQRLNRTTLAMEDFTSALFLDGQFSHAYYSRGTLLRDTGQYLFALADFDKALRYGYPDPARAYVAESIVYEKLNRQSDARDALTKALAANPNYEPAHRRLAALDGLSFSAVSGDAIQTAAVSQVRDALPAAKAPPVELVVEDPSVGGGKQFNDRIVASPAAVAPESVAAVTAEETILAVETVPEDSPVVVASAQDEKPATEGKAPSESEASVESPAPGSVGAANGWAVQIASATSEEAAWSSWKKMRNRFKVLDGKEPVVVRADLGTKGVFYRLRLVGFDNQKDAGRECSALKAKGIKCFVSRVAS